jgi:hypothetical protein
MQQKIMGIGLSILGVAGLIGALICVNGADINSHLTLLMVAGTLGAIAFFTGIWLFDRFGSRVPAKKFGGLSLMGMKEGKAALLRMKEEGVAALIRVKDGQVALIKEGQAALMPAKESQLQ